MTSSHGTAGEFAPRDLTRRLTRRLASLRARLLYLSRRESACELVHSVRPVRILFICLGNICRSPYAELALRRNCLREGNYDIEARSAGFILPGRSCPPFAVDAARATGLDLMAHRSRLLDADVVEWADMVVAMDPDHERRLASLAPAARVPIVQLADLDPEPWSAPVIADPFDKRREIFDRCYSRIDRCIAGLLSAWRGGD